MKLIFTMTDGVTMIAEKREFTFDRAYRLRKDLKDAFNIYQAYDKRKPFTFTLTANHKITLGWQFLL